MINEPTIKLFLVDDDAIFLKALEIEFLAHGNLITACFATGEDCISQLNQHPDIIILDYHLDGIDKTAINGLETLDKIKVIQPDIPVIMLSAQDKIDVAINCMHHHAYDYVVKSETSFVRLQKIISDILRIKNMQKQLTWYMDRV
jgi:two-component system OmpR family response regulator